MKLLNFVKKDSRFKSIFFLSCILGVYDKEFLWVTSSKFFVSTELLLFFFDTVWVLHESYSCFAFLGSLLPPCMLPNYSKFKSIYNFGAQLCSHVIKDSPAKDKSMVSHGSSKRERMWQGTSTTLRKEYSLSKTSMKCPRNPNKNQQEVWLRPYISCNHENTEGNFQHRITVFLFSLSTRQ